MGGWSRKVTLAVAPEDDIDAIARRVFRAIVPRSGAGFVTRVRFHIEHVDGRGRSGTLKFDVFGRNKSSIQSERDPARRGAYRYWNDQTVVFGPLRARFSSMRVRAARSVVT